VKPLVRICIAGVAAVAAAGCASGPADHWQVPAGDHALEGRIWSAEHGFVEPRSLVAQLASADYVLLGEIHDHPDHHRLQAWLLARLVEAGRRPVVVVEMNERDQRQALEAYRQAHPGDADGLGEALSWEERGWPAWALYRPIFEVALDAELTLAPGNLPRDIVRRVARNGLGALPAEDRQRLTLEGLPAEGRAALRERLAGAHCGHLPDDRLDGMLAAQRSRDAFMASVLARHESGVLIAGNGHLDGRWGVPVHLARRRTDARIAAVAPVEVRANDRSVDDYQPLAYDYVWFTPARPAPPEPCKGG